MKMKNIITNIRHFMANVVCAFIYDDMCRKRVRVIINTPYLSWRRFVRRDCGIPNPHIKLTTGFSGRNLVFIVENKYVYKFTHTYEQMAERICRMEHDIATALSDTSPIPLATPTILHTPHGTPVRRYDFASGLTLRGLAEKHPAKYRQNRDYLAAQIANFMYEIARQNPAKIRDLRCGCTNTNPNPGAPGYMYGWHHDDMGDNFMIDPKTLRVTCVIDLESMAYGDFSKKWTRDGCKMISDFMLCVRDNYDSIWRKQEKTSK